MAEINELYENAARRDGEWKIEGKVEVWRSKGQGSRAGGQGSDEMDRKLADARKEDAEFEKLIESEEGLL